jgi:hypothetical protein
MKTALKKTQRAGRMAAVGAAMVSAGLLLAALVVTAREAEATSPGLNGKIAFASDRTTGEGVNNPEGDFEIFTINRDGSDLQQLTENAALDFDPEWPPDGQKIAFESDRGLFSEIFVLNAAGRDAAPTQSRPAARPGDRRNTEPKRRKKSKLYGLSEYLMIMHELEKARLARQARKDHQKRSLL